MTNTPYWDADPTLLHPKKTGYKFFLKKKGKIQLEEHVILGMLVIVVFVQVSVAYVGEPSLGAIISVPINLINDVCATEYGSITKIQCIFKMGNLSNTVL